MKKLFALTVALCLFCGSFAFAESVASDGTPLQQEDFTLNLEAGMIYSIFGEKKPNSPLLLVFPYAAAGDQSSNINFVPTEEIKAITVEEVRASIETAKQNLSDSLSAQGITVESIEFKDPVDFTISGAPCVLFDSVISITYLSVPMEINMRQFYVGEKGYVITITLYSSEADLDKLTELTESMLVWN